MCLRIFPHGTLRWSETSASALWALPVHVPGCHIGESAYHLDRQLGPPHPYPMYFFLSNLSMANICFTSTTIPKVIVDIQTHSRVISYGGCLTQMSFLVLFGCMDGILLTAMAYNQFVAICHPLHYSVIMNPCLCFFLIWCHFSSAIWTPSCTVW